MCFCETKPISVQVFGIQVFRYLEFKSEYWNLRNEANFSRSVEALNAELRGRDALRYPPSDAGLVGY